ncbi:hypothetical protein P7C73_g1020, partial [Tremellales sp. Uapishka_1]
MTMSKSRIKALASYPVLVLLHLLFTLSSLLLRIYEVRSTLPSSLRRGSPPNHVGFVFVGRRRERFRQSVRRIVKYAGEEGIRELSVWSDGGLVETCQREIVTELLEANTPPGSPKRDGQNAGHGREEVLTLSVWTETRVGKRVQITVHLLPTPSRRVVEKVTEGLIRDGVPVGKITEDRLNMMVSGQSPLRKHRKVLTGAIERLHFKSDPGLLFVHHLERPIWGGLLPRAPPELHGYPFWTLRITEIYQYPQSLPFLPLRRDSQQADQEGVGVISREEWEGGMRAWERVEQRLGK